MTERSMNGVWRLLKWLRWTLLGLVSVLILVLALVSALVATEPGSRWVLNRAAERLPLTFDGMRGNLITGLDVQWVEYRLENQWYRVEDLSFRWQPLALLYSAVSVQSLQAGAVELHLPPPTDAPEPPEAGPTRWPSLKLPVRVELGSVNLRAIRIHRADTETRLKNISGTLSLGTFNLRVWGLSVEASDYGATVDGRVGLDYPYDARLKLGWHYRLPAGEGAERLILRGEGTLEGDLTRLTARHRLNSPVALESDLRFWPNLGDDGAEPKLEMDSRWPEQSLPGPWAPGPLSGLQTSGRLKLDGWLSGYQVDSALQTRGGGLPDLQLELAGRADLKQLNLAPLTLVLPEGDLEARGQLTWAPALQWQMDLALDQLNPAALPWAPLEAWPGQVGGQFRTNGELTPDGLRAGLSQLDLAGQLRSLALSLRGDIDYRGERLQANELQLELGANRLTLNGTVSDELALEARLTAPILSQLDPSLAGELRADIQLDGPLREPAGRVSVEGSGLSWQQYRAETLDLTASRTGPRYQIDLSGTDLDVPGYRLTAMAVTAKGAIDDHQATTVLVSEHWGWASWTLEGGYRDQAWDGALTQMRLEPPDPLHWELDQEAPLTLGADEVVVRSLCLSPWPRWRPSTDGGANPSGPEDGRICADGQWRSDGGASAVALIEGLPLRLARRWLTPEVTLEGTLEGRFEMLAPADAEPTASGYLETQDGALQYQFGEDDAERFEWRATRLEGQWREGRVSAQLDSDWGDAVGRLQVNLGLTPASGALEGRIQADFEALEPLEALIARLQDVEGRLSADVQLSGQWQAPDINGDLRLVEATAKLPELGLHLQELNLSARARGQEVDLEGRVTSGEGELRLTGGVDRLWGEDRQISAELTGERVQVLNTRQLTVLLNPDLSLTMNRERIDLVGEATIPEARAQFKSLPQSATRVSEDVVLKDPNGDGQSRRGPALYVDLDLALGDEVRFSGFGLDSRLSGQVQVIQNPERGLLTLGEVGVAEGAYKAYGQDLNIERGRLIFQGPHDNPGLDIRATREVDEYTVGLQINGTLQRPKSQVFSTPSLPESEAMAMLFTGKSLSNSSSADASMLVNAIGGLGLERSSFITAEIADTFGLDEFRIQPEDNVRESSLYIGKYLTPDLFVRYVVGLFDQTSSVGLRYEITEELRLEAESGLQQSVDLIYKFER